MDLTTRCIEVVIKRNTLCRLSLSHLPHSALRRERPRQSVAACVSVSTQTAPDDQAGESWDELSLVGIPDAIDVQALFDPTGRSRPAE